MTSPRAGELSRLQRRIRVALGQEPGDLLLTGGSVVNVFTGEVEPASIVIADGWIAGVGIEDWPAHQILPVDGRMVLPGLIDGHMHLESTLLLPAELARLLVPRGTTALILDPHEIANVLGVRGIDLLLAASEGLPLDLFFMAPSCVPAVAWEDAGAVLGPREVRELLKRPRVLGLAEVMDVPAVLAGDRNVLEKVRATRGRGAIVDGHAPALSGRELMAYAGAGMRSDHECTTVEEARERGRLGMLVQVREGSAARNLDTLLPLLAADSLGDWCLATDDISPADLMQDGHLDGLLRRVVAGGVPAPRAVRHATLVPARHYGLRDRGAVAPGYRADLVVVDDLRGFRPSLVVKDGKIVAREGEYLAEGATTPVEDENTIHVAPLDDSAFRLVPSSGSCPVIRIVPGQILTRRETQAVECREGRWAFSSGRDQALVACIERHRATGRIGLGLVAGFGFRRHGALGSSVAHDSHNLLVAGTNPGDMRACAEALADLGGGWVVLAEGRVQACVPLPVAGLLSTQDAATVCRQVEEVSAAARELGCLLPNPFGTLSFLALPVIPELRITVQGLFDVTRQELVRS